MTPPVVDICICRLQSLNTYFLPIHLPDHRQEHSPISIAEENLALVL